MLATPTRTPAQLARRQTDDTEPIDEPAPAGAGPWAPGAERARELNQLLASAHSAMETGAAGGRLHIVRLFAPEAVQNGTQNVTIGE